MVWSKKLPSGEVQPVCIWRDSSALQSRTQQCIRKCISGQLGGLQWTPNGSQCACASIQFINLSSSSSAFSFALSSSSEQKALFNFGFITIEEGRSICWLANGHLLSTWAPFYQVDWYFSPPPSLFLFMSRITFQGILSL